MDTHAAPAPRRTYAARITWAVLTLAAAFVLFFAITYAVNSNRVAAAARGLHDSDASARAAAVKELGKLGLAARSTIPVLLDLFRNDPSDEVQVALANALWRIGPDTSSGVVWLHSKLDDPDPSVRTHAAFILGCDRPNPVLAYLNLQRPWVQTAVAMLIPATRDRDEVVRWMAVTGLMRYAGPSTPEAVPALIQALDADSGVARNAAIALNRIGPPASAAAHALAAEVRRPYPPTQKGVYNIEVGRARVMKLTAAIALGNIGGPAVPELVGLIKDPDANIREAALIGFHYAGAAPVPGLIELLRDSDAGVRKSAAEALGNCRRGAQAAAPELARALKEDKDAGVRKSAVDALPKVGGDAEEAAAALASALKDEDDEVASNAVFALWALGPGAKSAVSALLEFGMDEKRPEFHRHSALMIALEISPEAASTLPASVVSQAKATRRLFDDLPPSGMPHNMEDDINPLYR